MRAFFPTSIFCAIVCAPATHAAISTGTVTSPATGNGHNVTFDGRVYVVARGGANGVGWYAAALRPKLAGTTGPLPDVSNVFSPWTFVQDASHSENALALCEETSQPTACDAAGAPSAAGDHACYDLYVFDSDAVASAPNNVLRRRRLKLVVSSPGSADASVAQASWTDATLTALAPTLRGMQPTITKDGRLLVWQGQPSNSGGTDTLVYAYNPAPCAVAGWTTPKSISSMSGDADLVGKYKLAERPFRSADGAVFAAGSLFYGAYPWLFPSGEAMSFTATYMPCRGPDDPSGCGARRNALSVIGYVTNWTVSHVDGAVNPATDDIARLFFSSPGPTAASPLPLTKGIDVWPFFGSNTANYTELVFDDALDGSYAGFWHMNELVTAGGTLDGARTADSSGYANTGQLRGGATFPAKNNGFIGKALVLDGVDGRVEIASTASLQPVNQITIELLVKPAADPDCDGADNARVLVAKGSSYSVLMKDDRRLRARMRVEGGAVRELTSSQPLPIGIWSKIAVEYDGATGTMAAYLNGMETDRLTFPPALLAALTDILTIGGPDGARPSCPSGDGPFAGVIDEVAISRVWRYGALPPAPDMAASSDLGTASSDAGVGGEASGDEGCAFATAERRTVAVGVLFVLVSLLVGRRATRGRAR